jgi:2-polyprenyl-3-methyl-5-hydroxy-6-metoxy-1,4-benzoquinol methylase
LFDQILAWIIAEERMQHDPTNEALSDPRFSDAKIVDSWHKNAAPWSAAVRSAQIESRRLITDQSIIDAVTSRAPESLLDLGCGEGWLIRALNHVLPAAPGGRSIRLIGVDVVPSLIEQAIAGGGGEFQLASYEQVATGRLQIAVDVVVCNFSLLGKESVESIVAAVPSLLTSNGSFIVQTLHPVSACGNEPYRDGWRAGTWHGFSNQFSDPAPWYFRTLGSWVNLFRRAGLRLLELREPLHPVTGAPASVIFIADAGAA